MSPKDQFSDFSNVVKYRNFLTSEEMPDGAYGSPMNFDEPVQSKNTTSQIGQQPYSAFNNVENPLYEMPPRQMDGAEPEREQIE